MKRSSLSRRILLGIAALVLVLAGTAIFAVPAVVRSTASPATKNARPAWLQGKQQPYAVVHLGDAVSYARLAASSDERVRGLSGVANLEADEGMLFIFESRDLHAFWMHEMLIPLDMIFFDGDSVVAVLENLPNPAPGTPDSALPIYSPNAPSTHVLEVNAGWSARNGVTVGSPVQIELPEGFTPLQ